MEKFGRKSEDNRRESDDPDCQVFVRNIPVALSKDGLYNIFIKAGTVKNFKLMPPKESHFATTYGFVTYTNKTEAATAVEMFDEYKIGGKYLTVKLNNNSNTRTTSSSSGFQAYSSPQKNRSQSTPSHSENITEKTVEKKPQTVVTSPSEDDIWSEIAKSPKMRTKNSFNDDPIVDENNNAMRGSECNTSLSGSRLNRAPVGRGALLKYQENKQAPSRRGNFDLSRPYARRLSSRRKESESNENTSHYQYGQSYSESVRQILDCDKNSQELVVGEKYRIDLIHVITPSNFFVEILSTVPKVSMNLNDYYKNGQHEENNISKLERGSIRCKLHNLVPTDGKKIWHPDTTTTLEAFKKTERNNRELLIAEVYSCDEFKSDEGRFEKIYGIDIYFGGEESVITYFIDEGMAVKSSQRTIDSHLISHHLQNLNDSTLETATKNSEFNRSSLDCDLTQYEDFENNFQSNFQTNPLEDDYNMIRSVSMTFSRSREEYHQTALKCYIDPKNRNKLFNCSFKFFKKRDIVPSIDNYKCGQSFECLISYIQDSGQFYVQKTARIKDLEHLEDCIQKYANILIEDSSMIYELYAFQENCAKFDVVLVKAAWDNKWHRAIFLEKLSSDDFVFSDESQEDLIHPKPQKTRTKNKKNYFSFFLIDYGREDMIITTSQLQEPHIFMLPINEKLMVVGNFALRCSLNESSLRMRQMYGSTNRMQEDRFKSLFEGKFKKMMENRKCRTHLCQITTVQRESEALVTLYLLPEDAHGLALQENVDICHIEQHLSTIPFLSTKKKEAAVKMDNKKAKKDDVVVSLKLNAIYFIMRSINLENFEDSGGFEDNDESDSDGMMSSEEPLEETTSSSQQEQKKPLSLSITSIDEAIDEHPATPVRSMTPTGSVSSARSGSGFRSVIGNGSAAAKPLVPVKKYINIKPIDGVKLSKNEQYKVSFQFFDQDLGHVYLTLFNKAAEEQVLCQKLQEPYSPEFVTMLAQLSDLKLGDKIEALFDLDEKWYRACVTNILSDRVQVHFLDYGNSESILAADVSTKLRFRKCYENAEDEKIFNLEYQALKCVYANTGANFVETLLSIEDFETNGFDVRVKEIAADGTEFLIYRIIFTAEEMEELKDVEELAASKEVPAMANSLNSTKSSTDLEVEKSFACQQEQAQEPVREFEVPQLCSIFTAPEALICNAMDLKRDVEYNVSISHIVGVTEFYVQSTDNLANLMDHQERIQDLAETKGTPTMSQKSFNVGDFVLVNYAVDQCWYKGVITAVNGETCNVYFVDYGNSESDLATRELRSTASLYELFSHTKNEAMRKALDMVLEFPFQSICCQLQHKKESTRNTEVLKTLMSDCFNFSIKVQDVTTQKFDSIDELIKKNIVNLYSDVDLLDKNFEDDVQSQPEAPVEKAINKPKANKFEIGSVHEFSVASVSAIDEIYLHQVWQVDILDKLQARINQDKEGAAYKAVTAVNKSDAVLAKFYEEDRVAFSWYRAVVLDVTANNEVSVFFTDYGNVDETLVIADLRELPEEFSFEAYPPYGHHITLSKVSPSLEDHNELLTEYFTSEGYHFKVIDNSAEVNGETLYSVELWNKDMTECLNAQIDPNYQIVQIDVATPTPDVDAGEMKILKTSLNILASELDANELCVSTEFIFVENFQKPFYFCLKKDMENREKLKQSLNQFYESQSNDLKNPQVNDFCAVKFEESWYRAQFKKLDKDQMYLFYLDYGFEEVYDSKIIAAKVLDKRFYNYARYVFGACLLSSDLKTTIDLDADFDMSFFDETFEKFFSANSQEHTLKIRSRLLNTSSEIFVEDVVYYGVQIFNSENECLNDMISDAKENKQDKTKLEKRPELIRMTSSDLPKQSTNAQTSETDIFRIFSRRIDLFYVFEESRVKRIQNHVKSAVDQLLEDQKNYAVSVDDQEKGFYNIGDLVFGKNEDDQTWYRCLITNRNKTLTKFELFFIDFGNTEIMPRCDVLCGWDEKQISVFRMYEPQAFQCKLYALQPIKGTEFDEAENKKFREQIKNKLFTVTFINHLRNKEGTSTFEIVLYEADAKDGESVNQYLVSNQLAAYDPIPRELVHKEIIEFWIKYLQNLPMNSKQFL